MSWSLLIDGLREPLEHGAGLAVAGAFREHGMPELGGLDRVAAFLGQHGEIAPGEMPIDAHVQAGELFGTPQSQDPPPARFGLGRFAPLPMHHRLAEQELGVLIVEGNPSVQVRSAAAVSPSIWCDRAIRANSFRVIESLGADRARLLRR